MDEQLVTDFGECESAVEYKTVTIPYLVGGKPGQMRLRTLSAGDMLEMAESDGTSNVLELFCRVIVDQHGHSTHLPNDETAAKLNKMDGRAFKALQSEIADFCMGTDLEDEVGN